MAPASAPSHPPQPAVSCLSPKPCRTCGRIITPRSKWAKNWDEIKFCSDSCRTWRSIAVYRPRKPGGSEDETGNIRPSAERQHQQHATTQANDQDIESLCLEGNFLGFFSPQPQSHRSQQPPPDLPQELFHLEAWLESLLLFHSLPAPHPSSSKKARKKKLEDVELAIESQLQSPLASSQSQSLPSSPPPQSPRSSPPRQPSSPPSPPSEDASPPSDPDHSIPNPKQSFTLSLLSLDKPGRRELLRRTARKLVVFPFSELALARFAETTGKSGDFLAEARGRAERFELWRGRERVRTLEGVSFAKGILEIDSKRG